MRISQWSSDYSRTTDWTFKFKISTFTCSSAGHLFDFSDTLTPDTSLRFSGFALETRRTHLSDTFPPERSYRAGWWFDRGTRPDRWGPGAWRWGPGPRSRGGTRPGRRPPGSRGAARSSTPRSTRAPPPSPPARWCTYPSPPGWWCRGSGCRACPWCAVLSRGGRWHWHVWAPTADHRPDRSVTSSCTAAFMCPLIVENDKNTFSFSPGQLVGRSSLSARSFSRCAKKKKKKKEAPLQNFSNKSVFLLWGFTRGQRPDRSPGLWSRMPSPPHTLNAKKPKLDELRAGTRPQVRAAAFMSHRWAESPEVCSLCSRPALLLLLLLLLLPEQQARIQPERDAAELKRNTQNRASTTPTPTPTHAASDGGHVSSWTRREETAEHMRSLEFLGGTAKEKWMFLFFIY